MKKLNKKQVENIESVEMRIRDLNVDFRDISYPYDFIGYIIVRSSNNDRFNCSVLIRDSMEVGSRNHVKLYNTLYGVLKDAMYGDFMGELLNKLEVHAVYFNCDTLKVCNYKIYSQKYINGMIAASTWNIKEQIENEKEREERCKTQH